MNNINKITISLLCITFCKVGQYIMPKDYIIDSILNQGCNDKKDPDLLLLKPHKMKLKILRSNAINSYAKADNSSLFICNQGSINLSPREPGNIRVKITDCQNLRFDITNFFKLQEWN